MHYSERCLPLHSKAYCCRWIHTCGHTIGYIHAGINFILRVIKFRFQNFMLVSKFHAWMNLVHASFPRTCNVVDEVRGTEACRKPGHLGTRR